MKHMMGVVYRFSPVGSLGGGGADKENLVNFCWRVGTKRYTHKEVKVCLGVRWFASEATKGSWVTSEILLTYSGAPW